MKLKELQGIDVQEKKVLVRAPFDVPIKNGKITDNSRIRSAVPTVKYLLEGGAAIVLIAKLGRPEGKRVKALSLAPVAKELERLLGLKVNFLPESVGQKSDEAKKNIQPGEIILLENLRFSKGEEENDPGFAHKLAEGMDLFVMEDFPNAKNNHAGITGVAKLLPTYAGINMAAEVKFLEKLLSDPKKPFVAVLGGAKVSSKIEIIKKLIEKVDVLILGGGMANTFFAAEGYDVGKSLYEEDFIDTAEEISRLAEDKGVELLLPDDVVAAKRVASFVRGKSKAIDEIAKNEIVVDIGPKSVAKFSEPLKFAGTIFWNGPVGIAEYKNFSKGTEAVAKIISESEATSIVGGGDTIAAVAKQNLSFSFVSTGGGATLEFLAGEELPGLEIVKEG